MRLKTFLLFGIALIFFGWATVYGYHVHINSVASMAFMQAPLLIDAGHGGKDNGASAADGTAEDEINLSIALKMRDFLAFCGYPVLMTRTEDAAVTSPNDDDARSGKVNDMYNRLAQYDAAAFTVSIHQNHFSEEKYHGTQVFYGTKHEESNALAGTIQKAVISLLQPDNKRAIKPAGENIFLLHRTERPAVIVECGFLSNAAETKKLKTTQYQQQMAFAIGCGVLQYTS